MFDRVKAISEIDQRQALRISSGLPLLNIDIELDNLERDAAAQDYIEFSKDIRDQVKAKILARMRRDRNDPTWLPSSLLNGGYIFRLSVDQLINRLYERHKRYRS